MTIDSAAIPAMVAKVETGSVSDATRLKIRQGEVTLVSSTVTSRVSNGCSILAQTNPSAAIRNTGAMIGMTSASMGGRSYGIGLGGLGRGDPQQGELVAALLQHLELEVAELEGLAGLGNR